MPTNPTNARILLKEKRAKVISRSPFSIQLLYETSEYTQPIIVGIDDGGKYVGIAVVSEKETLYQEEATLRNNIKSLLDSRRGLRRGRRTRKLRYRKPRFLNRRASRGACKVCGGNTKTSKVLCGACLKKVDSHHGYADVKQTVFRVPPSIMAKKNTIIRMVRQLPLPTPAKIIIEDAYFDFQAMENPDISGEEYQQGPKLYHKNYKVACLFRDNHECRVCKSGDNLRVHHIKHRADGGTDRLANLMTLCAECHDKYHLGELKLPRQKTKSFIQAAHVIQGKNFLHAELEKIAPLFKTFGYMTSYFRKKAQIEKTHTNDALVIADRKATPFRVIIKTLHVRRQKRDLHKFNPHKIKGRVNRNQERMNTHVVTQDGFSKNDSVLFEGKQWFVTGFGGKKRCYLKDFDGEYAKSKTGKKASKHIKYIRRLHGNRSLVRTYAKQAVTAPAEIRAETDSDAKTKPKTKAKPKPEGMTVKEFLHKQCTRFVQAGLFGGE